MEQQTAVMAIIQDEADRPFANQIAHALGYPFAHVVIGTPRDAAAFMDATHASPTYIVLDIGARKEDIFPELDDLAHKCEPQTQVVVIGQTNDIQFYRALTDRGVVDYFTQPVAIEPIRAAFMKHAGIAARSGCEVISFMSAAAGDGSSTLAVNTAFALANDFNQPTILIDMDYQFGMVAKNLDLSSPFGIKELFDHPDRGIDSTLLERMVVDYNRKLKVIAAPNELRYLPNVRPETIRDLILALQERYKFIVLDLPHLWSNWVSSAITNSSQIVLVAQLWLKSVTHAARLLNTWRDLSVQPEKVQVVINRSGAKFKEAVNAKDFERVCNKPINHHIENDIKTVVTAENQGKTIMELGKSRLSMQMHKLAETMIPEGTQQGAGFRMQPTAGGPAIGTNRLLRLK